MGLLIPTLKWTGLNSSLMISLCVFLSPSHSLSLAHAHTHTSDSLCNWKNRAFKSVPLLRGSANKWVKKQLTSWAGIKQIFLLKCKTNQKTVRVFPKAAGSTLHYVNLCGSQCKAQPQETAKTTMKVWWNSTGRCRWKWRRWEGGGAFFEGREQGAEWSRRGRNSAVGCISVSRSDGWVVALFVLCCHTAPRTSLGINERGPDRRAGTRRASDAGDLSSSRLARARRHMKTEGRGEAARLTEGQPHAWAPAWGSVRHSEITH